MSSFRKRQLVMDAETGLVGEVEKVNRRFVTVTLRLIRRKRGQRRFQHITTPTTPTTTTHMTHMTHDKEQAPC